jgi:hypothetical protein
VGFFYLTKDKGEKSMRTKSKVEVNEEDVVSIAEEILIATLEPWESLDNISTKKREDIEDRVRYYLQQKALLEDAMRNGSKNKVKEIIDDTEWAKGYLDSVTGGWNSNLLCQFDEDAFAEMEKASKP